MSTLQTPKNKAGADAECAALGTHVAAPETGEEDTFITQLVFHHGTLETDTLHATSTYATEASMLGSQSYAHYIGVESLS